MALNLRDSGLTVVVGNRATRTGRPLPATAWT
jgi:hypothetical protein